MFVLLVLMLMLMSWVFSLAYASVCAYAYACAYALVKTSLNRLMDVTRLELIWVGWPNGTNGEKLASTFVHISLLFKSITRFIK